MSASSLMIKGNTGSSNGDLVKRDSNDMVEAAGRYPGVVNWLSATLNVRTLGALVTAAVLWSTCSGEHDYAPAVGPDSSRDPTASGPNVPKLASFVSRCFHDVVCDGSMSGEVGGVASSMID